MGSLKPSGYQGKEIKHCFKCGGGVPNTEVSMGLTSQDDGKTWMLELMNGSGGNLLPFKLLPLSSLLAEAGLEIGPLTPKGGPQYP